VEPGVFRPRVPPLTTLPSVSCARLAVVAVATVWLSAAPVFAQTLPAPDSIPRCEYNVRDSPAPTRVILFPDDDLFRPLLADPKEPRTAFDYRGARAIDPQDSTSSAAPASQVGGIAVGGNIGIWARKVSACHGLQVSVVGGVFAQFNMGSPSRDLINSDYIVGAQVAMRTGRFSGRVRLSHQSTHRGEDLISQNPSTPDPNFGFQALEGLVSLDSERWRAYGGAGYVWFMNEEGSSVLVRVGGEFRSRRLLFEMARPVAGIDLSSLQSRSWGVTMSANAGVEWTSPAESRRMRLVIVFTNGYSPYGQASLHLRSRTIGAQWQVEF